MAQKTLELILEVDTGAELSTIPAYLYHKFLSGITPFDDYMFPTKEVNIIQVKNNYLSAVGLLAIVENVARNVHFANTILGYNTVYFPCLVIFHTIQLV